MEPHDYKHIRAWGKMMGSFEYYIMGEQEKAAADNAPLDAIYKREDGWHTYSSVTREDTRQRMDSFLRQTDKRGL